MEKDNQPPDLRSTIYGYSYSRVIDDPVNVHADIVKALNGFVDRDVLITAFGVFQRIGIPIPKIAVVSGAILDESGVFDLNEIKFLLNVIVTTGSRNNYQKEIDTVCERNSEIAAYMRTLLT